MRTSRFVTIASLASLAAAGLSFAQGVGNLPALPTNFNASPAINGWSIGPVGVIRDPNGPAWIKTLEGPQGGPFVAAPGTTLNLMESLVIQGNLPWTDWHETILTPGWVWLNPNILANSAVPSGLTINNAGSTVDFYFDPLYPGTKVDIRKQLHYVGSADGTAFFGTIQIAEFPTPEPASLGLIALGSAAVLRRRSSRVCTH